MTALELELEGVRFYRDPKGLRAQGPKGRADLTETLRVEVDRRISMVRDPRKLHGGERCELCGDELAVGRGGWCSLCVAARQKALRMLGVIS